MYDQGASQHVQDVGVDPAPCRTPCTDAGDRERDSRAVRIHRFSTHWRQFLFQRSGDVSQPTWSSTVPEPTDRHFDPDSRSHEPLDHHIVAWYDGPAAVLRVPVRLGHWSARLPAASALPRGAGRMRRPRRQTEGRQGALSQLQGTQTTQGCYNWGGDWIAVGYDIRVWRVREAKRRTNSSVQANMGQDEVAVLS